MISNFALSLSFDGIELLHRVPRGWRRVGHVDIASETLDDDLAALREKAEQIAPDGLRTKLIIPLDQIKYTAIDSTMTTDADIHAKLEGATPYALDELVIDCERFGGRTHIAAVARDTLNEAEAFAAGHGFQPIAFVAVPEPFTFQKEVFFGPTSIARDIVGPDAIIDRDPLPVMVVGTRIKSRLLVFDLPEDVTEDVYKDDLAALLNPQDDTPAVSAEDAIEDGTDDAPARDEEPTPIEEAHVSQAIWVDRIPAEYHAPVVVPAIISEPEPETPKEPLIPQDPVFAVPSLLDRTIAEYHPGQTKTAKSPLVAVAHGGSRKAPKLATVTAAANRTRAPQQTGRKPALIAAGVAAAALLFGGVIWSQQDTAEVPVSEPIVVADVTPETPATVQVASLADTPLEPGPAIPEIVTTGFGSDEIDAAMLPKLAAETVPNISPIPAVVAAAPADPAVFEIQAPPALPEPETAQASVGEPILRGQVLSPAEAQQIYEATGVWQRAPRFFDVPTGVITMDFSAPAGTTPPDQIAQPEEMPLEGLDTDLSFIPPGDPPAPEVVFPLDENGFVVATPEGAVTPQGAVVYAGLPDLTITPRPDLSQADLDRMALLAPAPDDVVLIAGRPDVVPPLRPAEAQLPEAEQDPVAAAIAEAEVTTDAPAPGSVGLAGLELQNTGAVGLDPEVIENTSIVDLRPQLRPQGLAPAVDPGTPDITDIIAGIETEDATLRFDNSTALAVALSLRPDARPSGFGSIVAAAQSRMETRQAAAAAPAPVSAAAPVPPQNFDPVPGGVARAATQEDAIRLREINLIGVYGRPNARRALVRLSNGRYVRVEVGSALDGGQVTAIGDDALNYVKRGRTYAIELPSG